MSWMTEIGVDISMFVYGSSGDKAEMVLVSRGNQIDCSRQDAAMFSSGQQRETNESKGIELISERTRERQEAGGRQEGSLLLDVIRSFHSGKPPASQNATGVVANSGLPLAPSLI